MKNFFSILFLSHSKVKLISLVLIILFFSSNNSFAENVPQTALASFSVINIAKDNKDAQKVGANPGDVLRYEIAIRSETEPVLNALVSADTQNISQAAEIIDTGLGKIKGNKLVFPPFSQQAPCEKVFTFFARIKKDCGGLDKIKASSLGIETQVPISCQLMGTGPGFFLNWKFFVVGGIVILFLFSVNIRSLFLKKH